MNTSDDQQIPKFRVTGADESVMNPEQLRFYRSVEPKLLRAEYVDVGGNASYVFVAAFKVLRNWKTLGLAEVHRIQSSYVKHYWDHEAIPIYCRRWAADALLALGDYDRFFEYSQPTTLFNRDAQITNQRLSCQLFLGRDADPIDLAHTSSRNKFSKYIKDREVAYRESICDVFNDYSSTHGNWFGYMRALGLMDRPYQPSYLFAGCMFQDLMDHPSLEFPKFAFNRSHRDDLPYLRTLNGFCDLLAGLCADAENRVRERNGIPKIGEGWVEETALFRLLTDVFKGVTVIHGGQPIFLGKQHYDIWFPEWKIAVEYHGLQHFQPVKHFGGEEGFKATIERDLRKLEISKLNNVHMIVVKEGYDQTKLIEEIRVASNRDIRGLSHSS
jgi:hypothetical protein